MVLGKMPEKGSGGSIDRFRKRLCGQRDFLEFEIILKLGCQKTKGDTFDYMER